MSAELKLLGWVPFDERTDEQNEAHEEIVASMPPLVIEGAVRAPEGKKILLTDVWSHPLVQQALGFAFPGIRQETGSCVGAGGGAMGFTLASTEVVRLGEPEEIIIPFWLLPYGQSRRLARMRGRGQGSTGSAFAKAVQQFGFLDARMPGLPGFRNDDGLVWGSASEYAWSDGDAQPPSLVELSTKKIVKTVSPIRSADEARESLWNLYPLTLAFSHNIGSVAVRGSGENAVAFGRLDDYGPHQTAVLGWMEHPELGELFLNVNQWPGSLYPRDPAGGPRCSVWMPRADMDKACRNGEVYTYSQYQGYPAQSPWLL